MSQQTPSYDLSTLTNKDLKEHLRSRGLAVGGKKAELEARLYEALGQAPPPQAAQAPVQYQAAVQPPVGYSPAVQAPVGYSPAPLAAGILAPQVGVAPKTKASPKDPVAGLRSTLRSANLNLSLIHI